MGFSYAVSWGLQSAIAAQFHEIALGVPLTAFSLSAFVRGRYRQAALWAAPLVLVKEDLGLTVAVLGGLIALRGARRLGALLAAYGVVSFLATVLVILPASTATAGTTGPTSAAPRPLARATCWPAGRRSSARRRCCWR